MIRKAQFNWERSLIKMPPNLLVTFYFAMLVALPMKVYKTNLVTSDLLPVVMTFFNTTASIVGATHKHASGDLPHPVQDKLPH